MNPLEADDPRVIGGFRLQARLGAGGMGRVYLGFSPAGRAVAVKVIHPQLARDEAFAARFRREVAAAQAVNTVYAVPAIAAGPDDDPPWLATAFIPAPSLQDVVATAGPLPEDAVWKLTAGLAEALRAIHAGGLVHRDLKPGNVLLAADGPRVIDFGIARVLDGTRLTSTGSVLGTPSFMSPEQAQGSNVEPASDVFSLGGVAYFAATGQAPFGDGIPATLLYRIVFTEPALDGLSPRLRSLVAACLEKQPTNRPTPAQLAAALMPAVQAAGTAAVSRPEFWPGPVAQFIHEYRARLDPDHAPAWRPPGVPQAGTGGPEPTWPPGGEATLQPPTVRDPTSAVPATPLIPDRTAQRPGGRHARGSTPAVSMGRRRALAALAGAAVAGLGVAGWEFAKGDPAGAGTGKLTASQSGGKPVPAGTRIWRFTANSVVGSIAVAGSAVYAGTNGNTVYALDAATGAQVWRRATTSQFNSVRAVAGGSVVVVGDSGVFALAADSGQQLWNVSTDPGGSPLTVVGSVVYAGIAPKSQTTGGVTALDTRSGELLWTYQFGPVSDIAGGLAVTGGVAYVTTTDGEIFTLATANGTKQKRIASSFGKFGTGTVAVAGDVLYAGGDNDNGAVFAVDTASGRTLWQRHLATSLYPAYLASANGVLFAGLLRNAASTGPDAGGVYALNASTGGQLWSEPVAGGVNLAPVVAGDVVYTGSNNGVLDAWQSSTGNKLWSYSAPAAIGSAIGVTGSRVYFGAGNDVYSVAG